MAKERKYEPSYTYSITKKGDRVRAKFSKNPSTFEECAIYLNSILVACPVTLVTLLKEFPMLRVPTETEQDNQTYFFLTDKDAKLYQSRKKLYEQCIHAFADALSKAFPDVEYCNAVDAANQEFSFTATEEEAKDRIEGLEALKEIVRKEVEGVLNGEGTKNVEENSSETNQDETN